MRNGTGFRGFRSLHLASRFRTHSRVRLVLSRRFRARKIFLILKFDNLPGCFTERTRQAAPPRRWFSGLRPASFFLVFCATFCAPWLVGAAPATEWVDLTNAVVVTRPGDLPVAERAAAEVLVEEVEKRTGIRLATSTVWPGNRTVIAITSTGEVPEWGQSIPARAKGNRPDGYRLNVDLRPSAAPVVWVLGGDARGALYGVGALLRKLDWSENIARVDAGLDLATAPAYPIRGHQLGYRARANSWDAWTPGQFDQYIRELTFFGVNAIENIPFQDSGPGPLMKVDRREMNRKMSDICKRYGLDYWVWTPADFDLNDTAARAAALDQHEQLYRDCQELTGVFFRAAIRVTIRPHWFFRFLKMFPNDCSRFIRMPGSGFRFNSSIARISLTSWSI